MVAGLYFPFSPLTIVNRYGKRNTSGKFRNQPGKGNEIASRQQCRCRCPAVQINVLPAGRKHQLKFAGLKTEFLQLQRLRQPCPDIKNGPWQPTIFAVIAKILQNCQKYLFAFNRAVSKKLYQGCGAADRAKQDGSPAAGRRALPQKSAGHENCHGRFPGWGQNPFGNTNFIPSGLQRGKPLQVGPVGKNPLHRSPFDLHDRPGFIFNYQMPGSDLPYFPLSRCFKADTIPGELFPADSQVFNFGKYVILDDSEKGFVAGDQYPVSRIEYLS